MKVSYSFGMIDLLHYGHIRIFEEAAKNSDINFFGLVSDKAVLEWTGLNITNYEERKNVISAVKYVDVVIEQETLDPLENLMKIHLEYPDAEITLYHGDEWRIVPSEDFLNSIGGKVKLCEYYDKLSRDEIIRKFSDFNENRSIIKSGNNLFSTKANTLKQLRKLLKHSYIEEMVIFTALDFYKSKKKILKEIHDKFGSNKIIIRSSSSNEDSETESNAGKYTSVLNIYADNKSSVINSIEEVMLSYKRNALHESTEQILIQNQTTEVLVSGVIFTRDIRYNRPFYTINYDESGSTDSVTSGKESKSILLRRDLRLEDYPPLWRKLILSVIELEAIFDSMLLDIEFAIKKDSTVVVFQVRPLVANYKSTLEIKDSKIYESLNNQIMRYMSQKSLIKNEELYLSDMAFWNPSEIIGDNPRNLDYSLYREIITKKAWNEGLLPLGYRKIDDELMYKFANKPYISLNYTFWTLIPESIDNSIALKLYEYYRDQIKNDKTAHDKVEFEIVFSCYDFETDINLSKLKEYGFEDKEIEYISIALKNQTEEALLNYFKILKKDEILIEELEKTREESLKNYECCGNDVFSIANNIKRLMKVIETNGTIPFSRQARYAFIAKSLCRSLINTKIVSLEDMEYFMNSVHTVATEFDNDLRSYLRDEIDKKQFDFKYGHLRFGTYDIRTLRYDQIDFLKLGKKSDESFNYSDYEGNIKLDSFVIQEAMKKIGVNLDWGNVEIFIKTAIEQRELFKFVFTKSLSHVIEMIATIGNVLGYSRNDMSYIEMTDIYSLEYYENVHDIKGTWDILIKARKNGHNEFSQMPFPDVITNYLDFKFIQNAEMRPNFITRKSVNAEIIVLGNEIDAEIDNKIVLIKNADPGYDWIFTRNIRGLITQYGGVASHMAIRCAEFGVPAAIGCGSKIYEKIKNWDRIEIDCTMGKLTER